MQPLILHLTRGVLAPTLDDARAMHNAFTGEGPQSGIEIARALGDLSHNVYTPTDGVANTQGAEPGELIFIDYWADPAGMETFFANPAAQQAADGLYSCREEMEWAIAPDGFVFGVPAPHGLAPRYLVMTRASVRSADQATAAVGKRVSAGLSSARRRGQISHRLFIRHADIAAQRPASNTRRADGHTLAQTPEPVEILALDWWSTPEGLQKHYDDPATPTVLEQDVSGPIEITMWQQQAGFTEW